ncbi:DJ-1/PfpI family protein [Aquimarina sp. D1M17]|uniref:DJ-1/PfpI family protein n=1 Tax=Aquimarina acroporae TaxID=2937283 RepID=UPI0020BEBBE0|nr:DJ-1/PfpI family protein [Aquimarina acroporae]MCK8520357.1 DJ-1/PfpI family protein [Aquimarina acroporae]
MKRNVGILIFDNAEVLDFAGPFEVFAVTSELNNFELFNVFTVSEKLDPISAVNGLSVNPTYSYKDCPHIDILIISGGFGARKQVHNKNTLSWIQNAHQQTEYTISICSGAMLLGTLGLLDNKPYCTHHEVYEDMIKMVPTGIPKKQERFFGTDKMYTSGGISAGIDLSFHIVEKLHGNKIAQKTAKYMEYNRTP